MKIECHNCLNEIDSKKERYVNLKTLDKEKEVENLFFHINCWKEYFDKRVKDKSMNLIKQSVPSIKELVKDIMQEVEI
jgi:hypothetical protein